MTFGFFFFYFAFRFQADKLKELSSGFSASLVVCRPKLKTFEFRLAAH
jgi:hypothetical protein